ncbi:MCE family protein [Actinomadura rupiterrae]|uniref:MCE family protein n=1 Tax=Actinomadura rupiterrae TaxID=559627 RepID=UPI0020A3DE3E|nr:MCE family protein [Actinomadura rupiterrae]MCP2343345.1 phospholipid/cholesterol/gamma-HCH transport system substrate-binding protein [Actinomadura rupiterrae]
MTRRSFRTPVRLGAAALAAAAALSGCSFRGVDSIPLPGGPDLGPHPRTVKVEFGNVLDLVPQSVVKVNDVSVGKVDKIQLGGGQEGWHALVTLKVRSDVRLPENSYARIGQTSLLGEKFVELDEPPVGEPARGQLASGAVIPLSRTTRSTEIEEVLSAMSLLLNGGGLEQVTTITRELNAAMSGRESTIRSVLQRINVFVGTLDRNRPAITKALDSLDRLTTKLAAERKTIKATIDTTGPAIEILKDNRADLTEMLVSLDKLSRTTTSVVNQSRDDLLANLKALDPLLRNLNKAGNTLPRNLETLLSYPFAPTFGNVIKGDYGNVRLTLDLDFQSIAHNLLGGTDLEGLAGGQQMRSMLKVPNVTLPRTPLGILPQMPSSGGLPGLGGSNGTTGGQGGQGGQGGKGGQPKPKALQGPSDLHSLMTGGLS